MIINAESALINGSITQRVSLTITDNLITEISTWSPTADLTISGTLIPGFVDIHCHGGGGATFSSVDPTEIATVIKTHRLHGTTTQVASLVTTNLSRLREQIRALVPFVERGELAGIHLEGPYISPDKCGAHDPDLLRLPALDEVKDLFDIGGDAIVMVTIAPELDGAIAAIEEIVSRGAIAAIGHTNADYLTAQRAIAAGASVVTHFYNALPTLDHREPTVTSAALLSYELALELILDGHHVNAPAIDLVLRSAPGRYLLVTDAMAAAGSKDGEYRIGDLAVLVKDGVARLAKNQSLAGSTLTMDRAFLKLISEHDVTLEQASYAASTLPAKILGIEYAGVINVGSRADFVEYREGKVFPVS